EYRKAPEVTRTRLYLETMEQILPRIREIYVMDKDGSGALPLLPLRAQERVAKPAKEVSP
ncbi:MAG: FtsH protease activity modulator HflK, partial [Deltaproteobacteria bacterium]|nr:FtsH protease activity modulator HflK [Deltaproteobacteria bacterium]